MVNTIHKDTSNNESKEEYELPDSNSNNNL